MGQACETACCTNATDEVKQKPRRTIISTNTENIKRKKGLVNTPKTKLLLKLADDDNDTDGTAQKSGGPLSDIDGAAD